MQPPPGRPVVYVAEVPSYNDVAIHEALGRALQRVGTRLQGNVSAVADLTAGTSSTTPAACTRPELVHGLLDQLLERDSGLFVGISGYSGSRSPCRRVARGARGRDRLHRRGGFWALPRLHRGRVALWPSDESRVLRYQLSVGRIPGGDEVLPAAPGQSPVLRTRQRVLSGWELYYADSVILMPKVRHDLSGGGFRGAVRLAGEALVPWSDRPAGAEGLDAQRLVDALEVGDPDLVVSDGVEIGFGGGPRTQAAQALGVVLVSDNAVAHDAVLARIFGLDPARVPHLAVAAGRGYGPVSLDEMDLVWEVELETLQRRVEGFGATAPPLAQEFPRWFEARTGHPFAVDVVGGEDCDPSVNRLAQDHFLSCFDLPASREKMKGWPTCSLVLGRPRRPPRHSPVLLVGSGAASEFRAQAVSWKTWARLDQAIFRSARLPAAVHRYRLQDGRTGWAIELKGALPSREEFAAGLFHASCGRIRSPLGGLVAAVLDAWWAWQSSLRRSLRNRTGIAVVHARKISRLLERPWRQEWLEPASLKRLPEPPPLPSVSPLVPRSGEESVDA